jgi:hypothetical protein
MNNLNLISTADPANEYPTPWPEFPVLATSPSQLQTLRTRHRYANLVMEARVVDFWAGCERSNQVRDYLHAVGFDVPAVDRSARQYKVTCGIVSAKVACLLWGALDCRMEDVSDAVRDEHTEFANVTCELFTPAQIAGSEPLPNNACQAPGRPLSRFLKSPEVVRVANAFWQDEWAAACTEDEPPGPPCARCGEAHVSVKCPSMCSARLPDLFDWYECTSLDACLAGAVRDLKCVASTGSPRTRILSVSDDFTAGTGSHYFTVAYSIRPREV